MPTLRKPSHFQTYPTEFTGNSRTGGITAGQRVRSTIDPVASTGNSIDDHVEDLKSRMGHFTDTEIFKGEYSNSTTYDQGDEVYWLDPDNANRKRFFKRLSDGDDGSSGTPLTNSANWDEIGSDVHNIPVRSAAIDSDNDSLLFRHSSGAIYFNRAAIAQLRAARSEQQVADAINTELAKVVTNARWRGAWARGNYGVGDYATHSNQYFRCILARTNANTNAPNADTTGWSAALTGLELEIAKRLEDIHDLLANRIDLPTPSAANRGRWVERAPDGEGYAYHLPPMQWAGTWNDSGNFWFGDVTIHESRLWVLTDVAAVTDARTGAATAPGTDSGWTEISIGHTSDVPGFKGAWSSLNGATLRIGDIVSNEDQYYIAIVAHEVDTSTSGPAADSTNFDLLTNWVGAYQQNHWYHEGTVTQFDDEIWIADADISSNDPEPGDDADVKWRQITGATQADLDQLRADLEGLGHGARTARGVLVDNLQPSPSAASLPEVWLPRKASRTYTVPNALIQGSTDLTIAIGDEPGSYALTSGTINRATMIIGHYQGDGAIEWYGAGARKEDNNDLPWPEDFGKITHNPVGSGILGAAIERVVQDWHFHIVLKDNILQAMRGESSQPAIDNFQMRYWQGTTEQTALSTLRRLKYVYLNGVTYSHWRGVISGSTPDLKTLFDDASNEAERTITFGLGQSGVSSERWLGNNAHAWTRQPPISSSDDIPVFSQDAHEIRVMSRADFLALTEHAPRTLYLTHS